jgi:hypothetical protein
MAHTEIDGHCRQIKKASRNVTLTELERQRVKLILLNPRVRGDTVRG